MANKPICKIDGCDKPVHYSGMCSMHAERARLHGDPLKVTRKPKPVCTVEDCGRPNKGFGYCQAHLSKFKKYGDPLGRAPIAADFACSVDGCERRSRAKGLCEMHGRRVASNGDVGTVDRLRKAGGTAERFYQEVVLQYEGDECLIWPFNKNVHGYAHMHFDGRNCTVSRRVCEDVNGPPPPNKNDAAHSCGNGHLACVSKRHMSWKSRAENFADKLVHGTHVYGEKHGQARLTEADVRKIRELKDEMSQAALGKMFGVNPSHISRILSGYHWAWLMKEG